MKKILAVVGMLSIIVLGGYVVKYYHDLSFDGNESIIILKDYDEISSLSDLVGRKEFENKVLYVDMWGVYCRPCIEEFKNLNEIKERYKDKEVEFVYLASPYNHIDDVQKWKAAIKNYNLEGNHMLMNLDFYKGIWDEVPEMEEPFVIPHYLLIDKNKMVIDANAPRPSQKEKLYSAIDNLL
ncbi:TlpA disulfide reductase family protein [Marivirga sp.]|uniref:TlpA family protein disulfide reductase n=1 Tax=Marivirga sp. TaxID=2018662 RepID=UPI002D7E7533|nr:TlpA disulfide reductase family protein [Marivirga sp.]HET8860120.1 TlpA disulfide reductase family protein [Marivirga sp.]